MVIDDDVTFRQVMARRLEQTGAYKALTFGNREDALAAALTSSVHAILLDLRLAEESGLDAIHSLKSRFSPEHLVILTGYASIATSVEAIRRGATDYLPKPISSKELLALLSGEKQCGLKVRPDHTEMMSPAQLEWEQIQRVLTANDGNVSATAQALGMHRRTLQRKLQKHAPRRT